MTLLVVLVRNGPKGVGKSICLLSLWDKLLDSGFKAVLTSVYAAHSDERQDVKVIILGRNGPNSQGCRKVSMLTVTVG